MPTAARDPEFLRQVGRRLRLFRMAISPAAAPLAREFDVSRSRWSQWEKGGFLVDPVVAIDLATTYGLSLDWLYIGRPGGLSVDLLEKIRILEASEAGLSGDD